MAKSPSAEVAQGSVSLVNSGYEAADAAADCLSLALEYESGDPAVWRLLGAIYLGRGRTAEFKALSDRYAERFSEPFSLDLDAAQSPGNASIFPLPVKIDENSLPEFIVLKAASAGQARGVLDFSRVRRASNGGLIDLTKLLKRLHRESVKVELRGIDAFINSVMSVADSEKGSQEMWDLLFAYKRIQNDADGFDDIALRYAERFSISPPAF